MAAQTCAYLAIGETRSMTYNYIVDAYERQSPIWDDLRLRIEAIAQSCLTHTARCEDKQITPVLLRNRLQSEIVPIFCTLRKKVQTAESFFSNCQHYMASCPVDTRPLMGISRRGKCALELSAKTANAERLTQRLLTYAQQRVSTQITAPWRIAKDAFEKGLTVAEEPLDWRSAARGYIPTLLGGTWPRVDKVCDAYVMEPLPPEEVQVIQYPHPSTCQEEVAALDAVTSRIIENLNLGE